MKSQDEIKFIQEIQSIVLSHPWSVVYSQFYFLHWKWSIFHGCTCIKYHSSIFNGGIDESSSMNPRLLEGTSLGYEHPRNICGSHGLQQSAKHPFIYFLEKRIGVYLRRFNTKIKFNDLNSHMVSTFHGWKKL